MLLSAPFLNASALGPEIVPTETLFICDINAATSGESTWSPGITRAVLMPCATRGPDIAGPIHNTNVTNPITEYSLVYAFAIIQKSTCGSYCIHDDFPDTD